MKKRHNLNEIRTKLREAEALEAQGQTQNQIANKLGISLMTFHRWRNGSHPKAKENGTQELRAPGTSAIMRRGGERLGAQELKLENARLRNLVADLLLDKVRL